jgi:hypothetical protein
VDYLITDPGIARKDIEAIEQLGVGVIVAER